MPVTKEQAAPYAPSSAIVQLIERYRNKGLQKPIDADVLGRSGVSDSLIPRTLQALRVLDLIDDQGTPTETFEAIRLAPESKLKEVMGEWLTSAYADVLSFVDPDDEETPIRDAFRAYTPVGQQARMVSLFIGLCREAGMRDDAPPPQKQTASGSTPKQRKPQRTSTRTVKPKRQKSQPPLNQDIPPALAGLLTQIPSEGGSWTAGERDKFIQAFQAVLDFCVSIDDTPQDDPSSKYEGDGDD